MAIVNQYRPATQTHPGVTLKEKLSEIGMGAKEFAIRTAKPIKTVSNIINGKSSITPDMAVQFENVLKIPANFWLKRQQNYNEALARAKRDEMIKDSIEWAKKFPYTELAKLGWVKKTRNSYEKTKELLNFFSMSKHTAWENVYFNQQLQVNFRISLTHSKEPYALSAWLRIGELVSQRIEAQVYNKTKFLKALPKLKEIMATNEHNFFKDIQKICLDAGVVVIYTLALLKAPINGAIRWIGNNPVIQISDRFKRHDIFWFSLFHEIGHIILHGNKKNIFLENTDFNMINKEKEKEADEFAVKWALRKEEYQEILRNRNLTEDLVTGYAKKFVTHPGIIVGRLQHDGLIKHWQGTKLIVKIDLKKEAVLF
jgi:addiction module HigA family antidote